MTCLTRIQDPSKQQVPSIGARLRQIYVQQGVKALFAGVIPRTMWISAGGAIFLGVYERAVHGLMSARAVH
jgi:solute carrier family 25 S-adenosylmethionine transporter 26